MSELSLSYDSDRIPSVGPAANAELGRCNPGHKGRSGIDPRNLHLLLRRRAEGLSESVLIRDSKPLHEASRAINVGFGRTARADDRQVPGTLHWKIQASASGREACGVNVNTDGLFARQ